MVSNIIHVYNYEIEDIEYAKAQMKKRVQLYEEQISQYRQQSYNETQVRIDFVNPFFKLLGWDVDNSAGLPQHLREVTHEATVMVEENGKLRSKKPDYSFKVGTETLFYLETKKPSVDITVDSAPAFQVRRYGWSGNLKISVLTNFSDLYIYDCSVRPLENDNLGVALIAHYNYREYIEKFDEIYSLLSKEAVLSGNFEKQFGNIKGALHGEPFDEYFLAQIKYWRNALGESIVSMNSDIDDDTLNICVQRILNRIIFLRICEDRSFEQYETLKQITTYSELRDLFIVADEKYDSGLFALLEEDKYIIPDNVIIDIFCSLYYPNNSYEFSVVDPYIIGQIYELFLDESLSIQSDKSVIAIKKPEAVDSQGAVNTPKNITDIIVEQTLLPIYSEKTIPQVSDYRIADISCGSGNFLLSAYEFVINFYIDYYQRNELEGALQRGDIYLLPGSSNYLLSYALRRKILTNNIYGVDIDPLAVEVTKFSLLLKALEGTTLDEVNAFIHCKKDKILPNLDKNIKNGNSLVDGTFAQFMPSVYSDINLLTKTKMFDWTVEFDNQKFDALVGNPPYIRVQNMVRYSPEEYNFYKSELSGYTTADSDSLDKYYLFIERGLSILKENGVLGYVVPHKFMNIKSGKELRRMLSDNQSVKKILHFGTFQAFKNRSTYTCVLILSKKVQDAFDIAFIQDWNRFLYDHTANFERYESTYLSDQPWTFLPPNIKSHIESVAEKCHPLHEIADVFVGVQTSADRIYIIHADSEDSIYVTFTGKDKITRQIEKKILRKSIYDAQLIKYENIVANSYIIYPYKEDNGKVQLYSMDEMKNNFPLALGYLETFKDELSKRNMPSRNSENWFAYGRTQSIKRFSKGEHLIWPVLSLESNYVYDDEMIVFTGGGNGPFYGLEMKTTAQESIFFVQAVINHWLMELIVKSKASTFRGGYYSHGKQFIADLPILKIDFSDKNQKDFHNSVVNKVKSIMELSEKKAVAKNSSSISTLQRAIDCAQNELESLIDNAYGVHREEGASV